MKKRLLTVIAAMMLLALGFLQIPSFAAEASLEVTFYNDLAGSAAGEYVFTAGSAGTYGLYWGDANGDPLVVTMNGKELSYTALTSSAVKAGSKLTFSPQAFTAIPYGAKKLLARKGSDTVASYDIPAEKQLASDRNFAYGVISDLHYNTYVTTGGEDYAKTAVDRAFAFFKSIGVNNVFGTGDYSTNGEEKAYQLFAESVAQGGVTMLGCGGNHEVVLGFDNMYGEGGLWYKYVNKGVYDGTLEGVLEVAENGFDFVYQMPGTEDIFIFLCQTRWDNKTTVQKPLVEPTAVDWLESVLAKYKDHKMHLMMHTFLTDDDHEYIDGEGDITNSVGYGYHYGFNAYTAEEARLRDLLFSYDDLLLFNGHSHWVYDMQSYNENLNIFDYYGSAATCIHLPSVTVPRTLSDTATQYDTHAGKRSEGALMFSGDGYEIRNGVNFVTGEIDSYACSIIYDRAYKTETGKCGDTEYIFDKQLSTLRICGSGAMADADSAAARVYAAHADSVRYIYVEGGVSAIGKNAFAGMKNLARVEVKNGPTKVLDGAFADCPSLSFVFLPYTLTSIGKAAFAGCGKELEVRFSGTDKDASEIAVDEGNEEYFAANKTYEQYLITWKVGDYARQDSFKAGTIPTFGSMPSIYNEKSDKIYEFVGWNNGKKTVKNGTSLAKAYANVTYEAVFGEETDRFVTGELNKKISYRLDRKNGVLYIEGKGSMPDYSQGKTPYNKYSSEIFTVVIKQGVTEVGKSAFANFDSLRTAIVESGVHKLHMDAFAYCDALTDLYLPASLMNVGQGVTYSDYLLENIHYSGTQTRWNNLVNKQVSTYYNDPILNAKDVDLGAAAPSEETYTVTFTDKDGNVIQKIENVGWGEGVEAPEVPAVKGYTFVGYDQPYYLVFGDMTAQALYLEDEKEEPTSEPTESCGVTDTPEESGTTIRETTTETGDIDRPEGSSIWPYVGIAAGAVLLIAAVVIAVVVVKKKKK